MSDKPVRIDRLGDDYIITGEGFVYAFSKETGGITSLTKNGAAYIVNSGNLIFDRPFSGLDTKGVWQNNFDELAMTFSENLTREVLSVTALSGGGEAVVCAETRYIAVSGEVLRGTAAYTIFGDGTIKTLITLNASGYSKRINRAGIELILPQEFEKLEYFGRGKHENYCDRKLAAKLGVYPSTVKDEHFPFIPPSENGGHGETRWVELSDGEHRIRITGDSPFHFDARKYTNGECRRAAHDHETVKIEGTVLHIDAAHGPIGSDMAWSTVLPEDHELLGGVYSLGFEIELG